MRKKFSFSIFRQKLKIRRILHRLQRYPALSGQLSKIYQTVSGHAIDPEEAVYWSSGRSYRFRLTRPLEVHLPETNWRSKNVYSWGRKKKRKREKERDRVRAERRWRERIVGVLATRGKTKEKSGRRGGSERAPEESSPSSQGGSEKKKGRRMRMMRRKERDSARCQEYPRADDLWHSRIYT